MREEEFNHRNRKGNDTNAKGIQTVHVELVLTIALVPDNKQS